MVDPISNNMASPIAATPSEGANQSRTEPAVQVTGAEAGRHGGNATTRRGDQSFNAQSASTGQETFDEINEAMRAWNTGMRFEIDEDTQRLVVSVIDTQTGDVLRKIPSDEVLHVAKMITQFQGSLVSTKA